MDLECLATGVEVLEGGVQPADGLADLDVGLDGVVREGLEGTHDERDEHQQAGETEEERGQVDLLVLAIITIVDLKYYPKIGILSSILANISKPL